MRSPPPAGMTGEGAYAWCTGPRCSWVAVPAPDARSVRDNAEGRGAIDLDQVAAGPICAAKLIHLKAV